jgi:hypothetical protein
VTTAKTRKTSSNSKLGANAQSPCNKPYHAIVKASSLRLSQRATKTANSGAPILIPTARFPNSSAQSMRGCNSCLIDYFFEDVDQPESFNRQGGVECSRSKI